MLDQSLQTPEQEAWLHNFIGFDFQIEYKPGKDNITTDALSRRFMLAWSETKNQFLQELKLAVDKDPETQHIIKGHLQQDEAFQAYTIRDEAFPMIEI